MIALLNDEGLRQRGITYSLAHRWRLIQAGKFPKPVKLDAWLEAEIESWINERIAPRNSGQEAA